ncbi:MAG: Asp23/Gls24 family envelope stress response protein [Coriobacteriales bacterium]|nr:Asp23/Gls24 family envelope stress response protein [Coriobacteriales bacterium]
MTNNYEGILVVSDDVIADLAGYAAKECYGVVGMLSTSSTVQEGLQGLLPAQRLRKGVEVRHLESGSLEVILHVVLEYGVNINAVSRNLVDAVQFVLKGIAQIEGAQVTVHVEQMKVRETK